MLLVMATHNLIFLIVLQWLTPGDCISCVKINNCACTLDDDSGVISLYDVGSIDPEDPLINGWRLQSDANTYFYYNPCYPFPKPSLPGTAACIFNVTNEEYCEIGRPDSVTFIYNGVDVVAQYEGNDCGFGKITTSVLLICDPFLDFTEAKLLGWLNENTVGFLLRSRHLCVTPRITTEETQTTDTTASYETTYFPYTSSEEPTFGTTSKPAILCDYQTLLGFTLKRCVNTWSDNFETPFAPPYLNTTAGEDKLFCSNIAAVDSCVQEAIQRCRFDGRVTAFLGSSGLNLQAAYNSLCAHPLDVSRTAFNCLAARNVEDYLAPLNDFFKKVDEVSDPKEICPLAEKMASEIRGLTSTYCTPWSMVWALFWDNMMAGCQ